MVLDVLTDAHGPFALGVGSVRKLSVSSDSSLVSCVRLGVSGSLVKLDCGVLWYVAFIIGQNRH